MKFLFYYKLFVFLRISKNVNFLNFVIIINSQEVDSKVESTK